MQTPKIQSVIRTVRWVRYALVLFIAIALASMFYRFGIVHIPAGYSAFPAGSYVLVDWKCQQGRALCAGDWVLFKTPSDQQSHLGLIKSVIPENNSFLLFLEDSNTTMLVKQEQIQARLLMVLMQSNSHLPKKE